MNDDDNDKSIITMMMLISFGDTVLCLGNYVFNSCKQQKYGMLNNYLPGLI